MAIGLWAEKRTDRLSEMVVLHNDRTIIVWIVRLLDEVVHHHPTTILMLLQVIEVTDTGAAQIDVAREALLLEEETTAAAAATEGDLDHPPAHTRLEEMHIQDHLREHVVSQDLPSMVQDVEGLLCLSKEVEIHRQS